MLLNSLCWTLVHSLWEGLLAALFAGAVLLLTRRSSAAIRYRLLTWIFFAFVAGVGITLAWELSRTEAGAFASVAVATVPPGHVGPTASSAASSAASFAAAARATQPAAHTPAAVEAMIRAFSAFCDTHALLIVSIWFVILLGKLLQTGWSLTYVRRIRRNNVRPPKAPWPGRLRELAELLGLRRPVTLLESGLVRVPMVVGHLKPIILVPMGILTRLPQDQLEAVLLHELAHIHRRDYLVNLLQGVVEAFLFFNPFVWWLSALIREEREHCCDDIAIAATRNKTQFINALVAFQEYSLSAPAYAVAFPGRRYYLLDRVKRIVNNRNKTLNAMEKLFLSGCLVVAACLTLAFTPLGHHFSTRSSRDTVPPTAPVPPAAVPNPPAAAPVPPTVAPVPSLGAPAPPVEPPIPPAGAPIAAAPAAPAPPAGVLTPAPPLHPAVDTTPGWTAFPPLSSDEFQGGSFRGSMQSQDNRITFVRGIWNNGDTYKYYMGNKKIVRENGVTTAFYIDGQKVPDNELDQHKEEIDRIIATLEAEAKKGASLSINNNQADQTVLTADRISMAGTGQNMSGSGVSMSGNWVSTSGTGVTTRGNFSENTNKTEAVMHLDNQDDRINIATQPIIQDILDQKLATDPKNLSFTLDHERLRINGVTQPKPVFEYFRNKYIQDKGDSYTYSRKGHSISSMVSRNSSN
ncbi:M56 family metallopeptidase [Dinghuibacter silviterrae]|uniref:Beta-lactamase regulating signal transducer with metallopeptidase domain n=1 Tax=Dinghuibacter silviterrae TaxID=1539049 RepID=A0A4R8DT17_9BACT|nr:M56 family metallopeptidase [Dinghuibacter silviterrae]TDX01239.1 beta-lactamase regulating signal transducer with metallopeptidase domain [Dinghuibacter silviterrae]